MVDAHLHADESSQCSHEGSQYVALVVSGEPPVYEEADPDCFRMKEMRWKSKP
jgi:hypothetical protein